MLIRNQLFCAFVCMILGCGLMLMGGKAGANTPPIPTEAQRQIVADALKGIQPTDPTTLETAETTLVKEGAALVPAIYVALAGAQGVQRDVLDSAVIRLTWKNNPRELVTQWAVKATHQPEPFFRQEHPPLPITDAGVTRTFPTFRFYALNFRLYPVARLAPEPLQTQNVFAVSKSGEITHLTGPDALQKFFITFFATPPAGAQISPQTLKDAAYAWLRLSQEFSWDGFFEFTIPRETLTASKTGQGWEASGEAVVTPKGGDRGKIEAALAFDVKGRLTGVKETRTVQAGVRPICQATKLLDPDPIVRGMAEQALLVMGVSARAYLAERRALAAPPLKQAIDRIWQQIVERERAFGGNPPSLDLANGH